MSDRQNRIPNYAGFVVDMSGFNLIGERVVLTTPDEMTMGDSSVAIDLTVAGATAVSLPDNAGVGQTFRIWDRNGDAGTNNITISPQNGETIEGGASVVINVNYGAMLVSKRSATEWIVLSRNFASGGSMSLASPGPIGNVTPGTGAFTTLNVGTNQTFTKEVNHTVSVSASTTAATAGGDVAYAAGAGSTSGAGGGISITGGQGGATGAGGTSSVVGGAGGTTSGTGGAASLIGGAGTAGNANGGAALIRGGAKNGSGTNGAITIGDANTSAIAIGAAGIITTFSGPIAAGATAWNIADPGNAGAIPVTRSGVCNTTTAGAETRTLAAPTFEGQRLTLCCNVDGGDCVITVASAFNIAGNTLITLNDAGDCVNLIGARIAGALRWRLINNDGATLG